MANTARELEENIRFQLNLLRLMANTQESSAASAGPTVSDARALEDLVERIPVRIARPMER